MAGDIVLGRFQPFHLGHVALLHSAFRRSSGLLRIVIGSANKSHTPENPWTAEERAGMIHTWASSEGIESNIEILAVDDIDDPPNWVEHAQNVHGGPGVLHTSDEPTAKLYEEKGWPVIRHALMDREQLQGWRIRATAMMLSTVKEKEALYEVLSPSLPTAVIEWLCVGDHLTRLAHLGPGSEAVG